MQKAKVVEVTHQAIYDAHEALKRMGERDLKMELVHRVVLTAQNVRADVLAMNEVQRKLSDKYVKKDDDGKKVKGADGIGYVLADPEGFRTEWDEFLQLTKEIEVYPLYSTDFNNKAELQANMLLGMMGIGAYVILESEDGDK